MGNSICCFNQEDGVEEDVAFLQGRIRPVSVDEIQLVDSGADSTVARPLQAICLGVIGTGRSSFVNTLLNSSTECKVSGGQLRGTRGCRLVSNRASNDLGGDQFFLDYIDCEGLRSDQKVKSVELDDFFHTLVPSIRSFKGGTVSHILFTLDVAERQTAPTMNNLLVLADVFKAFRSNCYLVLTKWDTNGVQKDWNNTLLAWCKKNRRVKTVESLVGEPPRPETMLVEYLEYLDNKVDSAVDAEAGRKMKTLLAFFRKSFDLGV
uniref:G domain-containing protein n=1 Tax=Mucochytrium quahogii TaxID=96639 RepID=A0A7S2SKM3_9STRA|mmetsp:Transcript_7388/g.16048  ORF Transcript_7388/g.16048 Transcript_7388/m.16048 type:complete len:264 (+) Transcript_7388:176-967(+)